MPPVADPIGVYLQSSLSKHGDSEAMLQTKLQASAKRALLSRVEFDPAERQHSQLLQTLQSKYIVLGEKDRAAPGTSAAANGSNGSSDAGGASTSSGRSSTSSGRSSTSSGRSQPPVRLSKKTDLQLGWGNASYPTGAGMVNLGNTCYLNSSLQALFHAPALVRWLLEDGRHTARCGQAGHGSDQCIVCSVARTLRATHQRQGGVVKPILVYSKLKHICKHLIHGRQEDAHEFVRHLLDSMQRCHLLAMRATKLDNLSKETTPLNYLFGGYLKTQVTCLRCQHASMTFQHFQDLLVDVRQVSAVDDALHLYFKKERLDGAEYKCDRCRMKVPATKKFFIDEAPFILCIQLKRFSLGGGKITKHVSFPNKLNVSRFMTKSPAQGQVMYSLVSLINHMGPSQNCGHYTATAKAANGQVYLFDDASVRMTSLNSMLNTNAYVLFYEMTAATRQLLMGPPSGSDRGSGDVGSAPAPAPAPPPAPIPVPAPAPSPAPLQVKQQPKANTPPPNATPGTTANRGRISFTVTSQSPTVVVKRRLPGDRSAVLGRPAAGPLVPYRRNSDSDDSDSENRNSRRPAAVQPPPAGASAVAMPTTSASATGASAVAMATTSAAGASAVAMATTLAAGASAVAMATTSASAAGAAAAPAGWQSPASVDTAASAATSLPQSAAGVYTNGGPPPARSTCGWTVRDTAGLHSPSLQSEESVRSHGSAASTSSTSAWLVTDKEDIQVAATPRAEPPSSAAGWTVTPRPMRSPQSDTTADRPDPNRTPQPIRRAGSVDSPDGPRRLLARLSRKLRGLTGRHEGPEKRASDAAQPAPKRARTAEPDHAGHTVGNSTFFTRSGSALFDTPSVSSAPETDDTAAKPALSACGGGGAGAAVAQQQAANGRPGSSAPQSCTAKPVSTADRPQLPAAAADRPQPPAAAADRPQPPAELPNTCFSSDHSQPPPARWRSPPGPRCDSPSAAEHAETCGPRGRSPDLSRLQRRRQERRYRRRSASHSADESPPRRDDSAGRGSAGDALAFLTAGSGLAGYGRQVATWSGERSWLEREQHRDGERRRVELDEFDDQLDAGRVKKRRWRPERPSLDHNPFQRLQEERSRSPSAARRHRHDRERDRHHRRRRSHERHERRDRDERRRSRDRVSR